MLYRSKANRTIDRAHIAICDAEARLMHSFTDDDIAAAGDELAQAQRFLARAIEAKRVWDAAEHDDYEEYPDVPETDSDTLL